MKIYQSEIEAGLSDALTKASIAFECDIVDSVIHKDDKKIQQSLAFLGLDSERQHDLYYLNSVLVSVGWNKNDDVFSVAGLWAAKDTPVHKQFNYMHDDTDIIGHITNSIVLDQNGEKVEASSADQLPETFDIITSAVIYKTWSDQDMRERILTLIDEIDEGKWYVSMECVFNDFDYAIVSPEGEQRVLSRQEETAFLTKHLRAYGGEGEFEGYKVGRLLKNFYFTGKGLVNKPANPRSVILGKDSNPFDTKAQINVDNFLTATEANMADTNKQVEDLQTQLDAAKAEVESTKADLQKKIDEKDSALAAKDETISSLEKELAEVKESLEVAEKKYKEGEEKMEDMKKKNDDMKNNLKNMKRKASLKEAGCDEDQAEAYLLKFAEASDEMFNDVVALIQPKQPEPAPEPVEEPADPAEAEEANPDDVDDVEEPAEAGLNTPTDEDEPKLAVASAADWMRKHVLSSTKNLKQE